MRNVQHDFRVVIADLIRSYKASCACMGLMCIVKAYLLLLAVIGYRKLYKMLCLCLLLLYVDLFIFNLLFERHSFFNKSTSAVLRARRPKRSAAAESSSAADEPR